MDKQTLIEICCCVNCGVEFQGEDIHICAVTAHSIPLSGEPRWCECPYCQEPFRADVAHNCVWLRARLEPAQ
jgi:hypothetical protein